MAVIGAAGTAGTLVAARSAIDSVQRVAGVAEVLSPASTKIENFLLVGSDSREGADPDDPDFGGIGDESTVSGRRSDTIMVLRNDLATGTASLLSIPRDLWVPIPGHGTAARQLRVQRTARTSSCRRSQEALDLPIHHYIEIDFSGFKNLVDAVGGVELCFMTPATGHPHRLRLPRSPGAPCVDGVQALAYARSRYFETLRQRRLADRRSRRHRPHRAPARVREEGAAAWRSQEIKANPFIVGDVLTDGRWLDPRRREPRRHGRGVVTARCRRGHHHLRAARCAGRRSTATRCSS